MRISIQSVFRSMLAPLCSRDSMKSHQHFPWKSIFGCWLSFTLVWLLPISLRADALDNWTRGQMVTNPTIYRGASLAGVTYGNGRFVAVGSYPGDDYGLVQTSEDGLTWTNYTTSDISILDLGDVAYGNGVFVTVGYDGYAGYNIYSSTNGINWSAHLSKVSNVTSITYGGGLFVAGSDGLSPGYPSAGTTNRNIFTSPDGITWTARNSGAPVNDVQPISDIAFGKGDFLTTWIGVDASAHSYVSYFGTTGWQRYTNNLVGYRINYCNGRFITTTGAGINSTSTDGITWVAVTNDSGSWFSRIIYAAGMYVACSGFGSASRIYTSTNLTNWTARLLPDASIYINAGAFVGGRFVIVGTQHPSTLYTPVGYASDPVAALGINPGAPPTLQIYGLVQHNYRIDRLTDVPSTNWQTIGTVTLTNSPLAWPDPQATNSSAFYRAVLLP